MGFGSQARARARYVDVLDEDEATGFVQPKLLLVLERRHRSHRLAVMMKRRHTHGHMPREVFDAKWLGKNAPPAKS